MKHALTKAILWLTNPLILLYLGRSFHEKCANHPGIAMCRFETQQLPRVGIPSGRQIVENTNHGISSQHGEGVIDSDHVASPEDARTPVSEVCDTALRALFEFTTLIGDSSPSHSKVERERVARLRLERALRRAILEPCRTVSDGRAKCVVFQQLRQVFPLEDERLHDYAIHVLAEMSDLLLQADGQPSSAQSAGVLISEGC